MPSGTGTSIEIDDATILTLDYSRPYSREAAAYPMPHLRHRKSWPTVARIDDGECFLC
jgi:hypothetical protein